MIDKTVQIGVHRVEGDHGLDAAVGCVRVCAHGLDGVVGARAAVQLIGEIQIETKLGWEIRCRRVELAGRRHAVVGAVALDADEIVAIEARAIQAHFSDVRGGVGGWGEPAHHFVTHQRARERGGGVSRCRRPERPEG